MSKRVIALIFLIGIVYIQIPFAAFHHHEHIANCSIVNKNVNEKNSGTNSHFHELNYDQCFECSAQLTKVFYLTKPENYCISSIQILTIPVLVLSIAKQESSFKSARAPPVFS